MAGTATPPAPATQPVIPAAVVPPPRAGSAASGSRPRPADRLGPLRKIAVEGTPAALRGLIAVLVILSLAWGGFGAWAIATHSSAASSLAHADERYSQEAEELYRTLSSADVTITTSFLQDSQPVAPGTMPSSSLAARQQFQADITSAATYLADLRDTSDSARLSAAIAGITSGLADYEGYVATAETEYAQGIATTGDSEMEVASEVVHQVLLPDVKQVYVLENEAVSASKGQATSLPTIIVAIVVAIAALLVLLRAQRWLARRTRRVLNPGLLIATAVLVISGGWLITTFALATSDLGTAISQGANPAESLAQASIDVQQIRGDSILNVIARSGTPSLQSDSATQAGIVGPGPRSLLNVASAAGNGPVTRALKPAIAAAPAWYKVNAQGYQLGKNYDFAAEQASVVGGAGPAYSQVNDSISNAIGAAQHTFTSEASAGASAFGPLEAVVIVAALIMAAASAWGLSRRLAEYR
jgi:hypothetical protein